jgi:uncharacterized membrane protein (UPF0127 family)
MTWRVTNWQRRLAGWILAAAAVPALAAEPAAYLEKFPRASAIIETPPTCQLLDLYLAVTPEQRAQGLMFIRELGEHEGMLFSNRPAAIVSMWMKNTYISLDMLFIAADGRIAAITAATTPLSEATISSPVPVTGCGPATVSRC